MRVVIDGDGNVIEGKAESLAEIRPLPDRPIRGRVFECVECRELIYAEPDEITRHECDTNGHPS